MNEYNFVFDDADIGIILYAIKQLQSNVTTEVVYDRCEAVLNKIEEGII